MKIELDLTKREWCRLYHMFQHIGEEAHDDATGEEPWYEEEFWNDLADSIESKLVEQGMTADEIYDYEEETDEE